MEIHYFREEKKERSVSTSVQSKVGIMNRHNQRFYLYLLSILVAAPVLCFSQPINDDCLGAVEILVGDSEVNAILTAGDSRGATASDTPISVCSGSWYTDDTWYRFRTPADLPASGIVIRAYFNNTINPTDVPAIGMAIYESCDVAETPLRCFSSDVPEDNSIELPGACIQSDHEYLVRIWSTGSDATTEGTFSVGVFGNTTADAFLWWETFKGGIEANGWSTEGECAVLDSNANAGWKYLPDGLLDKGAYIFAGAGINSLTLCDGAVGVDSDYDDNGGIEGNFGGGPCPAPGHHVLISPKIHSGNWNVEELAITWTQAIRQFQSKHYFAYRIKRSEGEWDQWIQQEINTEYEANGDFLAMEQQRFQLQGAVGSDSLQFRFTYDDNYYLWAIDDVKIVPHDCTNSKLSSLYAIPPFASIPWGQTYPFAAMADLFNAGNCPTTRTTLHCIVIEQNSMDTIYYDSIPFGIPGQDSFITRQLFPKLIDLGWHTGDFELIYTLSQDSTDTNPFDNSIKYQFSTGGDIFALEDGFTRSVSVANSAYHPGAPLSYAYGNYFRPKTKKCANRIIWGVNNTGDMAGKNVLVSLLEWSDLNHNQIAEPNERKRIGFNDYTFTGVEGTNAIIETTLENFESPGSSVIMEAGHGYMAMIEYQATSQDDPQLFLLASEERDFTGQQIASDSAFAHGLVEMPSYFSVLGFSPDGNISNIDYEVKELDLSDNRIFFGNEIVPLVRIVSYEKGCIVGNELLPDSENVSVFPNPASESIYVRMDFTATYPSVQISLINSLGQRILSRIVNSTISDRTEKIDVSELAAGLYQMQVETPEGQRTLPLMLIK